MVVPFFFFFFFGEPKEPGKKKKKEKRGNKKKKENRTTKKNNKTLLEIGLRNTKKKFESHFFLNLLIILLKLKYHSISHSDLPEVEITPSSNVGLQCRGNTGYTFCLSFFFFFFFFSDDGPIDSRYITAKKGTTKGDG